MELTGLAAGTHVFIDTNIFLYAISDHPAFGAVCNALFDRVKLGEVSASISVVVLNELVHQLVIGEIAEAERVRPAEVIRRLKRDRTLLAGRAAYEIVRDVDANYNLRVLGISRRDFAVARTLMGQCRLLSNDALHLAVMRRRKLTNLVSNDGDFESIAGVQVWMPSTRAPQRAR